MTTALLIQLPAKRADPAAAALEGAARFRERTGLTATIVAVHPGEAFLCALPVVEDARVARGHLMVGDG